MNKASEPAPRYANPAIVIHWLTAAAVLSAIPLGIAMINAPPGPLQNSLYDLHRSFGALVLALACVRLVVRLVHGWPPPHASLTRWEVLASHSAHNAMYVLIFVTPLIGWAGTSAFGAPITVFGLFVLPPILPVDKPLATTLLWLHKISAFTLTGIVAVHVAAALRHGFIKRDGVLSRMLPWSGR